MKYELFSRVMLKTDQPEHGLRAGDLATIVEHHPGVPGQESGYSLEVFNGVGDTIAPHAQHGSSCPSVGASRLTKMHPELQLDEDLRRKAERAVRRMLEISAK
jgi:hypothetical protein